MSRSRLLTSSTLPAVLLGVLLTTASCSAAPPVQEAAQVVVTVPGDVPAGDYADPRAVLPGPDGTLLVLVASSLPEAGAALAVVDPVAAEVSAHAVLAAGTDPDTAFGREGSAVVAGTVWPGTGPIGYALQVVDPVTGAVGATLPVAVPGDVLLTGSAAALGPDGALYVAVSRSSGPPQLLAVDPATGAVRASAPVDLPVDGAAPRSAEVEGLAVAPDGSRVVVAARVQGPEAWAPPRSLLAAVGPDLAPLAAPVDLTPGFVRTDVEDVVVAEDGTVYAAVRGGDAGRRDREEVVALAPGAAAPTVLTAGDALLPTPVADLAVDGDTVWLTVYREGAAASVVDLDPATGRLGKPVELCDEVVGSLLVDADGAVAVTARCAGEAVLWWLEPQG